MCAARSAMCCCVLYDSLSKSRKIFVHHKLQECVRLVHATTHSKTAKHKQCVGFSSTMRLTLHLPHNINHCNCFPQCFDKGSCYRSVSGKRSFASNKGTPFAPSRRKFYCDFYTLIDVLVRFHALLRAACLCGACRPINHHFKCELVWYA